MNAGSEMHLLALHQYITARKGPELLKMKADID